MGRKSSPTVVTLVGPKHSGKTSSGKALARLTGASFVDLDDLVEERTGKTPRALYEAGPEVFRAAEAEAAAALVAGLSPPESSVKKEAGHPLLVIAAGGGLVDNERALNTLREAGFLVSLNISAESAWARVCAAAERTGSLPPFLRGDDPEGMHRALHERRTAAYGKIADIEIEAENMNPAAVADEIARFLSLRRVSWENKRA